MDFSWMLGTVLSIEKDTAALYLIIGAVVPSLRRPFGEEKAKEQIEAAVYQLGLDEDNRKNKCDLCLSAWKQEWNSFPDREAMRYPMKRVMGVGAIWLILSVLLASKEAIKQIPDNYLSWLVVFIWLLAIVSLCFIAWFSFCLIRGLQKYESLNKFITEKIPKIIYDDNHNTLAGFEE